VSQLHLPLVPLPPIAGADGGKLVRVVQSSIVAGV
jgi:hypothetical protein